MEECRKGIVSVIICLFNVSVYLESKRLYKIVDDMVAITGEKSDRAASAQTLANQLELFVKDNTRITESFQNFKDNITSLGTAGKPIVCQYDRAMRQFGV